MRDASGSGNHTRDTIFEMRFTRYEIRGYFAGIAGLGSVIEKENGKEG